MRPAARVATLPLLLALALAAGVARAQVSPGALAAPHAEFDGATDCFRCHEKGSDKSRMDARCLDCHTEVAWMRTHQRGYHTRVASRTCASCHPDHGGREFALIAWDGGRPERFDHAQAGFALEGRHANIGCRDCHKPAFQKSDVVALLRVKDHSRSWLGLEPGCVTCHRDPHRGSLGRDCLSCHDQTRWGPAPGFDHARTTYPLTGAHTKPLCAACHATERVNEGRDEKGALKPRWSPVPHDDCLPCHADPHKGRFKGACVRCHVTSAWKTVNTKSFDHEQTRYPLRGAHVSVKCDDCHAAARGGAKPKFARCMDCHRDAHKGTATVQGKPVDCAPCHKVEAFRPSTWPRAEHQRTKYPLDGAHALATCESCHTRAKPGSAEAAALGPSRVRMRPTATRCVDCHHDPHAGRFEPGGARPHQAGCLACHSMAAFQPSTYDGRAHADCVFPLEGAHMAVPCQRCHKELGAAVVGTSLLGGAHRALPFDSRQRACADCHEDVHGGQFRARADRGACESCHDFNTFVPARKFDHDRDARFKLQGAHAKTPCGACHPVGIVGPKNLRTVVYRPTPMSCESCHMPDATTAPGKSPGAKPRERRSPILFLTRTGR